jgi:hypothetical protein
VSTFFELAKGTRPLTYASNFPWPFAIDLCFAPVAYPVAFSEGVGHGAAGCAVSADEALGEKWREHVEICDAAWLLPHIQGLANGEAISREDVLAEYEARFGEAPTSYESRAV